MQMTGAQIIIECLKEQGVDTVFGYPGGAILNVYDELYKHLSLIHISLFDFIGTHPVQTFHKDVSEDSAVGKPAGQIGSDLEAGVGFQAT